MKYFLSLPLLGVAMLGVSPAASATSVIVNAADVVYCTTNAICAANDGGAVPVAISVAGVTSITFSTTGTITLNDGTYNDADGNNAATASSSNTGLGIYGGITAPGAGYLVGLFTGSSMTAGAATNYTAAGAESDASYSPTQNQAFFIGDGLTGDGTGTTQTFYVPTGATELYLGISDAGSYNGSPGAYGDNFGNYTVNYTATGAVIVPPPVGTVTPEPSSLVLLGTGALSAAAGLRRRIKHA